MDRRFGIVALALLLPTLAACTRPAFQGQVLEPPRPALDFTLTDQFDRQVRLSGLRGQVVVLTFLYTTCPDICPLVTAKIRDVINLMGTQRQQVAFVAVTVDPERDTVTTVADYSQRWAMIDRWLFLTGSEPQLAPIWEYYWAGRVRDAAPSSPPAKAAYTIGHGSPVHLLDRAGQDRVVYDADFRPASMAHDIETLLAER
jgi:protein SCO1